MVSSLLSLRETKTSPLKGFVLFFYYVLESIVQFFIPESWKAKDVTGEIVLITGGGSGIGQLTAVEFVRLGCTVVIWDINKEGMANTIELIKSNKLNSDKCFCYQVNLCNRNSIYEAAKKVQSEVGIVDILINNAGIVSRKHLLDIPDEKIQLTFEVNTLAHFYTVKAFLPDMIKRNHGHIVTVASVAGNIASVQMSDYHAAKFANVGFDLALRMELAQANLDGIKTSIVKPYFIATGMFSGVSDQFMPFLQPEYVVRKIISGIRADTHEIIIPYHFVIYFLLFQILPSKFLPVLNDVLGGHEVMAHFEGRDGAADEKQDLNNNNNNNNFLKPRANLYLSSIYEIQKSKNYSL